MKSADVVVLVDQRNWHRSRNEDAMPKGTMHTETGLLLQDGFNLFLRTDSGGHWRLDASRRTIKLVGKRVTVEGVRDGFDLLAVTGIQLA